MSPPIRILVVDDQAIVRESLCAMLSTKPGLEIAGQAGSGEEAVILARTLSPDVILMDLLMPEAAMEGVAAIHAIRAETTAARILVLSGFSEDAQIIESIRAGAAGYILKSSGPDELVAAIQQIHQGDAPLNPAVARALVEQFNAPLQQPGIKTVALTERELEITRLVALGLGNEEIGERLDISTRTAASHVSNVLGKLRLANRTQLALYALRTGIASLYDESSESEAPRIA